MTLCTPSRPPRFPRRFRYLRTVSDETLEELHEYGMATANDELLDYVEIELHRRDLV